MKRRLSPEPFEDDLDTENIDPNILFSPSKKGKAVDGTPIKATITLNATPKYSPFERFGPNNANTTSPRPKTKVLSVSVPTTTNTTPIAHSRGSPKHKRVGLLNAKRRLSSPYRRIDPPPSNAASPLPISIDAALSGTLRSYKAGTPPAAASAAPPMPASWFFAIHEDSAADEAANLMEHGASTLDISSDEDCAARRRRQDADRGKENVPPEGWSAPARAALAREDARVHRGVCAAMRGAAAAVAAERMEEDRGPLREMDAAEFYPEGVDERDAVVVVEEKEVQKGVALLEKETFDFEVQGPPSPSRELEEAAVRKGDIAILADEL